MGRNQDVEVASNTFDLLPSSNGQHDTLSVVKATSHYMETVDNSLVAKEDRAVNINSQFGAACDVDHSHIQTHGCLAQLTCTQPSTNLTTRVNGMICFGMLWLDLAMEHASAQDLQSSNLPSDAVVRDGRVFIGGESPTLIGELEHWTANILETLRQEGHVDLQYRITRQVGKNGRSDLFGRIAKARPLELSVILYGTGEYLRLVGDFLERCDLYLQDPSGCNSNVRYRNAQSLWALNDSDIRMTQDIVPTLVSQTFDPFQNPLDLLADLEYENELPEAEQPLALQTQLYQWVLN